ncbi:rhodanese-like domain-containing protein [Kiloniella antarctica]|uniref:Rhodanese-like domain-containing protein n=1 Tax=Kiloniella antarctica TaxID=1550907 RepID=A0ABW5BGA3_9PROT
MVGQVKKISPSDLFERMKADNFVLIDIRSVQEYQEEYLRGSKNIPIEEFGSYDFSKDYNKAAIFYCRRGRRTSQAADFLNKYPFKEVLILEGGIMAWKAKNLSTVKSTKSPIDLMRQVQIIAGGLVSIGAILGFFVNSNYIAISGFVGVGLLLAGISGVCGLARVLRLMPWNKSIN